MSFHSIRLARIVADRAHRRAGQTRKGSGAPYITHCAGVARLVRDYGGDTAMIQAAYLHDTIEDTDMTTGSLSILFGGDVANLVYHVSQISKPEDGPRALRKALDLKHYAAGPADAQTIKLADIVDNLSDISTLDPAFAEKYLKEKASLVDALTEGNADLRRRAAHLVEAQQYALANHPQTSATTSAEPRGLAR